MTSKFKNNSYDYNNLYSDEEWTMLKELSSLNHKAEFPVEFEYEGISITNPFLEATGRFEFNNIENMCKYYGNENVYGFFDALAKMKK